MNYGVLLATAIASGSLIAQSSPNLPIAKRDSPFACDRIALTPEDRKRHFGELGPALRAATIGVRELPDGFEFEFPPGADTARLLSEWVIGERLCCPFFDISMRWDREGGLAWLRLTGRSGVKQFIKVDFAGWFHQ